MPSLTTTADTAELLLHLRRAHAAAASATLDAQQAQDYPLLLALGRLMRRVEEAGRS